MIVTKYEIDMLDVGAADALFVHFWDDDTSREYVVLIDAGNYDDGKKIAQFVRTHYQKKYIDLAIITHCDKDHFGGLVYLLEQQRDFGADNMSITHVSLNRPSCFVGMGQVRGNMGYSIKNEKADSVYDLDDDKNLINLIYEIGGINLSQPIADASCWNCREFCCRFVDEYFEGLFKVLGPSCNYYKSLVPEFRNDLSTRTYDSPEEEDEELIVSNNIYKSQTLDNAADDTSHHNRSSVIILFRPSDNKKFLFMGDTCRDSVDNLLDRELELIKNVDWLKVPHHGSKHNLDSEMINYIKPNVAYISTEKYGHYLSKAVVNTLKKVGASVYATMGSALCYRVNTPQHSGYITATPL